MIWVSVGGVSLFRGMTKKENRNTYTPIESISCSYSGSDSVLNKFYPFILQTSGFDNGVVPTTFIDELSGYFVWFDPNVNEGQTYWYKDGKNYVVYAHCQESYDKLPILLPDFMEGMIVQDIVEKTDGVTLLTDQVVNNRVFVSYDTTTVSSNYIVFVLK